MANEEILKKELETYNKHKAELLKKNEGKFVLIKEDKVINTFECEEDAIKFGIEKFGNSPFLVKKVEIIEQTQNFTSNLIKCDETICHH